MLFWVITSCESLSTGRQFNAQRRSSNSTYLSLKYVFQQGKCQIRYRRPSYLRKIRPSRGNFWLFEGDCGWFPGPGPKGTRSFSVLMPIRAQLPNELFSIIISELASDTENISRTRASLASCRLASHVLCSLTTPLFFSSIELKENVRVNSNNNLVAFLERARNLYQLLSIHDVAASVHTFTLCCGQYVLGYAIIGTLISTIFYRLPHIRNFTFKNTVERCSLSFSSIPRDLSSAIQALCKSPNLTMLDLNSINSFPITAITASPNLRCLRLSHTKLYVNSILSIIFMIANPIPVRRREFNRRNIKPATFLPGLAGD